MDEIYDGLIEVCQEQTCTCGVCGEVGCEASFWFATGRAAEMYDLADGDPICEDCAEIAR